MERENAKGENRLQLNNKLNWKGREREEDERSLLPEMYPDGAIFC